MSADDKARLEALDASIARGIADAKAGRVKPAEEVFDRLKTRYLAMAQRRNENPPRDADA